MHMKIAVIFFHHGALVAGVLFITITIVIFFMSGYVGSSSFSARLMLASPDRIIRCAVATEMFRCCAISLRVKPPMRCISMAMRSLSGSFDIISLTVFRSCRCSLTTSGPATELRFSHGTSSEFWWRFSIEERRIRSIARFRTVRYMYARPLGCIGVFEVSGKKRRKASCTTSSAWERQPVIGVA